VERGVAHAVERRLGPELGLNLVAAHPLLGADGQRDLVAEGGLHAEACLFAFARRGVGEVWNVDGAGELVAVPPRSHLRREHRADVVAELEVAQRGADLAGLAIELSLNGRPEGDGIVAGGRDPAPAPALQLERVLLLIGPG